MSICLAGSDNVGVELPVSEIEQEEWKVADKDLDSWEKAAANFESIVPENNGRLQLLKLCFKLLMWSFVVY